jgi:CP family cyanate transporter-like MFS transporter
MQSNQTGRRAPAPVRALSAPGEPTAQPMKGSAGDQQGALQMSWLVIAAGVLAALHVGKLSPALPMMSHELGISWVQSGFLLSLVQLAGMCLGLVLGMACASIGLRRCLWLGHGILALASLVGAFLDQVPALLVFRGIEGLGYFLVALSGPSLLRQLLPANRLHAMLGVWGAFMPLGITVALLFVPWLIQFEGWRSVWCVLSLLSLGMALLAFWRLPQAGVSVGAPRVGDRHALRAPLRKTLSAPGAWILGLTFASFSAPWVAVIGFLPSIYVMGQLSVSHASTLTALVVAVNVIGNVVAGQMLQRRVAADRLIRWAFVGMGVGGWLAFGLEAGQSWNLSYLGVIFFSACGGVIPATVFSQIVSIAPEPESISTTQGLIQQCNALGQFAGPPAMAFLASHHGGWHASAWAIALIAVWGVLLSWSLRFLTQRRVAVAGFKLQMGT